MSSNNSLTTTNQQIDIVNVQSVTQNQNYQAAHSSFHASESLNPRVEQLLLFSRKQNKKSSNASTESSHRSRHKLFIKKNTLDDRETKPWYLFLCELNGAYEWLQQLPILELPPKPNDMNAKTQGGMPPKLVH